VYYQTYIYEDGNKVWLPTLGGNYNFGTFLDDEDTAAGLASRSDDVYGEATVWFDGTAVGLGKLAGDTGSWAFAVNHEGVAVGASGDIPINGAYTFNHAFVWRDGVITDLNTLIPAGSNLTLNVAYAINDAGEIAGLGTDASRNTHIFVLHPLGLGEEPPERAGPDKVPTSIHAPNPMAAPRTSVKRGSDLESEAR
jgi:probable HAF family extracellular repeat protein